MDHLDEHRDERPETTKNPPAKKLLNVKLKTAQSSASSASSSVRPAQPPAAQKPLAESKSGEHEAPGPSPSGSQPPVDKSSLIPEQKNEITSRKNQAVSSMNWNFNVNSMSQTIHGEAMDYCNLCLKPILIYGRLIPCKHVVCIDCANADLHLCLKTDCNQMVERVEKSVRGSIFVCNYDLDAQPSSQNSEKHRLQPEYSQKSLCGRSYMSQRDLLAHVQHRHEPYLNRE